MSARFPLTNAGYWISPRGHCVHVETHLGAVCAHPECFGTNEAALRAVFLRHGEPWGFACDARKEIIAALVRAGWIRARHEQWEGWHIELRDLSRETVARAGALLLRLHGVHPPDFSPVRLDTPEGRRTLEVADFQSGRALRGEAPPPVTLHTTPADLPAEEMPEVSFGGGGQA